jgi:hypothetical protein
VFRIGSALALVLVLAGCTKGGQFDPTELFSSDAFDSKKKLTGEREPLFPNGVPGTTTGVPPDLMKGYQPPPDQTDASATPAAPAAEAEKPKPKPKPKPKLAAVPAHQQDGVWNQKPAPVAPTRISVGSAPKPAAPAQQQAGPSQSVWPAPSQQQAAPSQSVWPAPPPTAPAQQTAQPAQSIWPNPPAPGTTSQ